MKLEFQEYKARKIINVRKHVDGAWFWDKYGAHPYIGCRSGCAFCYVRGGHYLGKRDPETFDTLIRVKINAVELMRKELPRLEPDVITCGDWQQPAEGRYRLSRGMLQAVLEAGFPLFIVERSPSVIMDLDLLREINRKAWVGVVMSISSLDPVLKRAFEPRSPGVKQRLRAMSQLAKEGIQVGTALMPVIPLVGDDERHLEDVVKATKDHGGSFVLGAGLSMDGLQAEYTLAAVRELDPDLENGIRGLYGWSPEGAPAYSPPGSYSTALGLKVRELCARHGLNDRMPRYIPSGPLAVNKRVAEKLFIKSYDLELKQAKGYRIWAYRKAAWTADEYPESLETIYRQRGEAGLQELPTIGSRLAGEIARWLKDWGVAGSQDGAGDRPRP